MRRDLRRSVVSWRRRALAGFHVIPIYGANGPDNGYRAQWKRLLSPE